MNFRDIAHTANILYQKLVLPWPITSNTQEFQAAIKGGPPLEIISPICIDGFMHCILH